MFSIFFNVNLHAKKWRAEKWRIFEILSTNEMRHFLAHHCTREITSFAGFSGLFFRLARTTNALFNRKQAQ